MNDISIPIIAYSVLALLVLLVGSVSVIKQGTVGVAVLLGKYRRVLVDAMKTVVARSHGNILSFDGSMEGSDRTLKQMSLLGRGANAASGGSTGD